MVATEGIFFWYAFDDENADWQFASIPDPPEHLFVEALTLLEEDLSGAREMHYWNWMIPLWAIACPLTVLSAGLLLWPRSKRHQEVATEESAESLTPLV